MTASTALRLNMRSASWDGLKTESMLADRALKGAGVNGLAIKSTTAQIRIRLLFICHPRLGVMPAFIGFLIQESTIGGSEQQASGAPPFEITIETVSRANFAAAIRS